MMGEKWMKWTLGEAATKTSSSILQKVVGQTSLTISHTFWATVVLGFVQMIAGWSELFHEGKTVRDSFRNILGAILFGTLAMVSTVFGFATFLYGAELGARVFVITLSIIPGAIIDRVFFGKKLSVRQRFGIGVGILAGWAVLGSPEVMIGVWIWFALANMLTVAVNQGITQAIKDIDVMRKNFWGGLTAIVLGVFPLIVFGWWQVLWSFEGLGKLSLTAAAIGVIVVFMWSFNVWAYKEGAYISLKKLMMNGAYLSFSMILGILIFGDPFAWGKLLGVVLFLMALILMDESTWKTISGICGSAMPRFSFARRD